MPHWEYRLDLSDVFHDGDMPFTRKRDVIVGRIKANRWYRECKDDGLGELVDQLAKVTTTRAFDRVWNQVYDQADTDRAWIDTISVPKGNTYRRR